MMDNQIDRIKHSIFYKSKPKKYGYFYYHPVYVSDANPPRTSVGNVLLCLLAST